MRSPSIYVAMLCLLTLGACAEDSPEGNNGTVQDAASDTSTSDDTSTDTVDDTSTDDATSDDGSTQDDGSDEDATAPGGVYVSAGDSYATGALDVSSQGVADGENGAPLPLQIWSPTVPGEYAVVLFQHGFQLENGYYSTVLSQLASHGFIVVAPQLSAGLTGGPTAAEDATSVRATLDWLPTNLPGLVGVTPSFDHVGLSGHSRGAKVVWLVMTDDASYGDALAGIDPVDGTGGPLGGEERVIDGTFAFTPPILILGTGLGPQARFGQACAPEGENHVQFYGATQSPAWHVVATNYGHMDMLDANSGCGVVCSACPAGRDLEKMRMLTAGMLTAFFRGSQQGTNSNYSTLLDPSSAPAAVTTENK